jgi:hypothetical protein
MAEKKAATEYPRSFRFDARMKEDLDACAELSGSSDTEIIRRALRVLRQKLEREARTGT